MRVLICGGRDFGDKHILFDVLDRIHKSRPFSSVIHGAAIGADSFAGEWHNLDALNARPSRLIGINTKEKQAPSAINRCLMKESPI
jgi:hypothetical protein